MDEKLFWEVFFQVHRDIPREGPGSNESTRKAFGLIGDLPEIPEILDVGCGPGQQTLELARLCHGNITAVDTHQPFIDRLKANIKSEGLEKRLKAEYGDMFELTYPERSFDLIWSEGAIYIMGFERGLTSMKPLLKPGGHFVLSEAVLLKTDLPEKVRRFWEEYPAITYRENNLETITKCGYDTIGCFTLPESDWWEYYQPLEKQIRLVRDKYRDDQEKLKIVEEHQCEIDTYRDYHEYWSYDFYILKSIV